MCDSWWTFRYHITLRYHISMFIQDRIDYLQTAPLVLGLFWLESSEELSMKFLFPSLDMSANHSRQIWSLKLFNNIFIFNFKKIPPYLFFLIWLPYGNHIKGWYEGILYCLNIYYILSHTHTHTHTHMCTHTYYYWYSK